MGQHKASVHVPTSIQVTPVILAGTPSGPLNQRHNISAPHYIALGAKDAGFDNMLPNNSLIHRTLRRNNILALRIRGARPEPHQVQCRIEVCEVGAAAAQRGRPVGVKRFHQLPRLHREVRHQAARRDAAPIYRLCGGDEAEFHTMPKRGKTPSRRLLSGLTLYPSGN